MTTLKADADRMRPVHMNNAPKYLMTAGLSELNNRTA
jgi:hypothetical protein